jgi:magnesium-transporting ATPase (P-type)
LDFCRIENLSGFFSDPGEREVMAPHPSLQDELLEEFSKWLGFFISEERTSKTVDRGVNLQPNKKASPLEQDSVKCANIKSLETHQLHPHPGWEATNSHCYRLDVASVIRQLRSDGSHGLTQPEAARRLRQHGANELKPAERISPWMIFLGQFRNVLIAILLVATVLSIFVGHGAEAIAIALIVLFAVLLGFAQEYRSE